MGYALVIAFLLVQITCEVRSEQRYERHKLIRVHPQNTGEIYAMKRIQDVFRNSEFEFWKEPRKENQPIDIMVSPDASSHLTQFLKVAEIKHDIVITDIQALIDTQRKKRSQQEDVEDVEEQEDGGVNIEGDQQVPSKQSFNMKSITLSKRSWIGYLS
ncbi:carboxypeptidase A1-like [Saccoglossus kowalevskii]